MSALDLGHAAERLAPEHRTEEPVRHWTRGLSHAARRTLERLQLIRREARRAAPARAARLYIIAAEERASLADLERAAEVTR